MSPILESIGSVKVFGWGAAGSPYFLADITAETGGGEFNDMTVDSSGNIYAVGHQANGGSSQVVKFDSNGSILWQKKLAPSSSCYAYDIRVDSSGNPYVAGVADSDAFLLKLDSSGTTQWQKELDASAGVQNFGLHIDSSDNIYTVGLGTVSTYDNIVAKYNTSGTIQWKKVWGRTGGQDYYAFGATTDSSGNVYVVGQNPGTIVKYNSSGTLQWQKNLDSIGNYSALYNVVADSSDNIYVSGTRAPTNNNQPPFTMLVAKYNSSGSLQWQRYYGSSNRGYATDLTIDASNNLYVVGLSNDAGDPYLMPILKINSSGSLQWQRKLGFSSKNTGANGVKLNSNGDICFAGYYEPSNTSNTKFLVGKLPSDGSLTGTYTLGSDTFTYASGTLSDNTSSLTDGTMSKSVEDANSYSDGNASLTISTSTLTGNKKGL